MLSPSPGDFTSHVACSISISLFICTLRLHDASYINMGKHFNVVLNYMYFVWIISASDGVDVWHLQLDKTQLDSHVR